MKPGDSPQLISLREYERVKYTRLGNSGPSQLEHVTEHLGIPVFRFFREEAQAQQYVGVVKVGEHTIQILPKIGARNDQNLAYLVFLLGYARRLRLRPTGKWSFEELRGSFLEIWMRYF